MSSYFLFHFRNGTFNKWFEIIYLNSYQIYRLGQFFIAGSLLTFIDLKKINTPIVKYGLAALILLSLFGEFYEFIAPLAVPLLVMLIGISYTKALNWFPQRFGDLSYGIYIYGFLVQQLLMHFFRLNPISLMLLALPITIILAWLSWHFVEKPALKYKNLVG